MPLLPRFTLAVPLLLALAGCSSVENFLQGDKVDYKSQSVKTSPLEVPPDLTQLQRDGRYAPARRQRQRQHLPDGGRHPEPGCGQRRRRGPDHARRDARRARRQPALAGRADAGRTAVAATARVLDRARLQPRHRQRAGRRDGNRLGGEPRQDPAGHRAPHDRPRARQPVRHRRARPLPHPRRAQRQHQRGLHQPPRHDRGVRRRSQRDARSGRRGRPTPASKPSS